MNESISIPQIALTESQQWALNHALELEGGGHFIAAHWLRRKHFPDLPWAETDSPTHAGWETVFRAHHGSNPPLPALRS